MKWFIYFSLILSGCAFNTRSPETHFYRLDPVLDQGAEVPPIVIGIGPVSLASYLDSSRLIEKKGAELYQKEYQRWAGDLADNIAQVIADNISQGSGLESVWSYPYPPYLPVEYQIQFHIRQFELDREQKKVIVAGNWHWVEMNQRKSLLIKRFSIEYPVLNDRPEEQVAAFNQALADLGRTILDQVQSYLQNHQVKIQ